MAQRTLGQWIARELKYYALALPVVAGGWYLYHKRKQQQIPAELTRTMRDAREARASGDLDRAAEKYSEAAETIDTLFEARAGQGKARGGGGGSAAEIGTQFRVAAAQGQVFEEDGDAAAAARAYDRAVVLRKRQRKKLRWERRRAKLQRQQDRKVAGLPEGGGEVAVPLMTKIRLPWLPKGDGGAAPATANAIRPLDASKSPIDPELAAVLDRLAGIAQAQRNFADAEKLYVRALNALAKPNEVAAVMAHAAAGANGGRWGADAAGISAKKGDALRLDTVRCAATAGVLFNLHSAYGDAGRRDDATAILQRALAVCTACGTSSSAGGDLHGPSRAKKAPGAPDCSPIVRLLESYRNAPLDDGGGPAIEAVAIEAAASHLPPPAAVNAAPPPNPLLAGNLGDILAKASGGGGGSTGADVTAAPADDVGGSNGA